MGLSKTVALVAILLAILIVTGYAGSTTDTTAAAKEKAAGAGYRR
jgi:hypothetical protein